MAALSPPRVPAADAGPERRPTSGRRLWQARAGCTAFVLATLFLAFHAAGFPYRSDEVWSLHAVRGSYGAMIDTLRQDIHPPLYYHLLAGWVRWLGDSERASRALSGVLYVVTVLLVYRLGRERHGHGALTAVVYATSPAALLSAQFVRMYALLGLAAVLVLLAWLRLNDPERGNGRAVWPFAAAVALGSFTHVWFFFLLFALGVGQAAFHRMRLGRFGVAAVLGLLPYAVLWAPTLLRQLARSAEAVAWIPAPGLSEIGSVLLLQGGTVAGVALAAAVVRGRRTGGLQRETAVLLAVTLLVPLALSLVKPVFAARFTIVATPLLALLAAPWLARLGTGVACAALFAIAGAGYAFHDASPSPCSARFGAEHLARHARPGDVVFFSSLSRLPLDHYWDRLQPGRGVAEGSFPREIDGHPGFEGNLLSPARRVALRAEARQQAEGLRSRPGVRVFFLRGFRPEVDAILTRELSGVLSPAPAHAAACAAVGSYYSHIDAYER